MAAEHSDSWGIGPEGELGLAAAYSVRVSVLFFCGADMFFVHDSSCKYKSKHLERGQIEH